jgi:hypothetical protein
MNNTPSNGTYRIFKGKECVFYDGYWIRYYPVPADTLINRKSMIDSMTRRAFHHTETGINTPGYRLEEARTAYERETDPARKRVNGAMLAGALFNRATAIFTTLVDLEAKGVKVKPDNSLMVQCGECFAQALELGKLVKHYSGHEGIDELWGEPFKAFTQPLSNLFESRYTKIAQTMRDIDLITDTLATLFAHDEIFTVAVDHLKEYGHTAKQQIEVMKQDTALFTIWPMFVTTREALEEFPSSLQPVDDSRRQKAIDQGVKLMTAGTLLITYISEARVPMQKSTTDFLAQCEAYRQAWSKP